MIIKRVPCILSEDEERVLNLAAAKACRRPKEHVRYIVLNALCLIDEANNLIDRANRAIADEDEVKP